VPHLTTPRLGIRPDVVRTSTALAVGLSAAHDLLGPERGTRGAIVAERGRSTSPCSLCASANPRLVTVQEHRPITTTTDYVVSATYVGELINPMTQLKTASSRCPTRTTLRPPPTS
jgi:hypothetical protein